MTVDAPQTQIRLPDRLIGQGEPCFIIAEAGINHNGDLGMALDLVDAAAHARADAVKFQLRDLPSLYPENLLKDANLAEWAFQYILPSLKAAELSYDEFSKIKQRCDEQGIRFLCTPWDEPSLAFLQSLDIDLYKVGSGDLVNLPLLEAIASTGVPLILSTGMAVQEEIRRTVVHLRDHGASFALLHCVSTYPAPFESLNLRYMETLREFGVPVGYSGHERGIAIPLAAVAMGAAILEKHITPDRTLQGPDHSASLEPDGFKKMVRDIRNFELALGDSQKTLNAMEIQNRQVLRKSLVASCDLQKGTVVTREMVKTMGPGKGLTPQRLDELIGVTLERDVAADDCFTDADVVPAVPPRLDAGGLRRKWGLKARFHDLSDVLELRPKLVELHFSEEDLDVPWDPSVKHDQQLVVHAPEFAQRRLLDLASENEERREASIAVMQRTIDRTVEISGSFAGESMLVIHVGGMSMDEPATDVDALLAVAAESFGRLDAKGLTLLPENLPPRPWYLGGQWFQNLFTTPEQMMEFCEALDLEMTLDLSHAQLACAASRTDLEEFVETCLPSLRHLHVADASGIDGEGLQIGEGVIRWEPILEMLEDQEFTWVPEIWSGHLHECAGFITAVNRLAAYGRL